MSKEKTLNSYVLDINEGLIKSLGIKIPDSVINSLINKYEGTDLSYKELIESVVADIENYLEDALEKDKDISLETKFRKKEEKKIEEMAKDEKHNDIKLNDSDINLMMIASSSTPQELQNAINKIPNLNINLKDNNLDNLEFNFVKNMIFEQYRDSIPEALRDIGDTGLVTMEEYKNLSDNINNEYDSVTIDNGDGELRNYDLDKGIDVEDYKADSDLVNNEEIDMNSNYDSEYVESFDNDFDKKTFSVDKKNHNKDNKVAEMRHRAELDAMISGVGNEKTEESKERKKETHKVLRLQNSNDLNSEKGYIDTLNIMLSILSFTTIGLLLLLYFIIN